VPATDSFKACILKTSTCAWPLPTMPRPNDSGHREAWQAWEAETSGASRWDGRGVDSSVRSADLGTARRSPDCQRTIARPPANASERHRA
jgi:hypothetical protein